MQKTLLSKTLIVAALTFFIAIPLMMIQSTIAERMRFHDEALHSIAADSVREQVVIGPLLVIPYTDEYEEELLDPRTQKMKTVLYGTLYGLLRSENNALVMGSMLLFGMLAAIMIATRKVD